MADRFVDDGGDNTDGTTWAKAYTSVQALQTAEATFMTTSSNRVIFGADSNCTDNGVALTITGPTSGLPVIFISSTVSGAADINYSVGTGDQILAYNLSNIDVIFDGAFALYGIRVKAGRSIAFASDDNESCYTDDCTFCVGALGQWFAYGNTATARAKSIHKNVKLNLWNDGTTARTTNVVYHYYGNIEVLGVSMVGTTGNYRTGTVLTGGTATTLVRIDGFDFSNFTHGTACEIISGTGGVFYLSNCLTAATWTPFLTTTAAAEFEAMLTNCGPADAPTYLAFRNYCGDVISSSSIYRTGGADVEGDACSWLITTTGNCSEGSPFYTPWMYGTVSTTGAKTFDLYITNDTADFTDAQVWLEVECLATADEAQWSLATDQRATITTTAAAQDDDTVSVWVGSQANMLDYSEQFDNATWTKTRSNVTANATTDPLGGNTADKFYDDGTVTNTHLIATGGTDLNVDTYTFSVYAKAAERSWIRLMNGSIGATQAAYFDLTNGVTGTVGGSCTAAISSVGNGWYRCSITFAIASFGSNGLQILLATGDNGQSYSGDSASGVYIWGAQCELAGAVSAYSATTNNNFTADYTQKLSVPATIGETGQYRARVAVGVASIAGSRYFYIDPKITVS